jgi:hypothetical protein
LEVFKDETEVWKTITDPFNEIKFFQIKKTKLLKISNLDDTKISL